ncbi:tRNA (5-methylaminomethyl-2-thiouridine)(34)-methyltransferase MnmD [Hylemonella gracilis]|uniref:tRNA 5-methylaminomethyl-2-thiouridine biosynthesis bifunctional protein MnmC n=1 Tax=Hylemonella gracilis ATCC 19624 TaxID=887062 RepID=F3KR42_9BURK|nr:tRNA (5-methylaminomethyl-2-thiouridine)(34)-methyltransferase MnmD [Hylemonella gracilis]EGI77743.1 tRNA U-34 5-methylaminomethyl-2-thiouridine biosynthesis protein MnmC [Hylemonella gracilis ATCC 19624]
MSEPVTWREGTPYSARFDDLYRTTADGLAQARRIFLGGCGLRAPGAEPAETPTQHASAWAGQRQWRILETGFGLGLNFLAAWQAWRHDGRRPGLLHFVSIEAFPVAAEDIVRGAQAWPELSAQAEELAAQWRRLEPGASCPVQRLSFEHGRVLLTLCLGDVRDMLRELRPTLPHRMDSVFLDGFAPQANPDMWSPDTLRELSTLARRGATLASWTANGAVRRALAQSGWQVEKVPGLPPKRESIRAVFAPRWEPTRARPPVDHEPARCVVIGAGLAGAAAAASLARRGWQVTVLDAGQPSGPSHSWGESSAPRASDLQGSSEGSSAARASDLQGSSEGSSAARASDLPVGLFAPHVSPDDNLLSRLTRAGIRQTVQAAEDLSQQGVLRAGRDWSLSGVRDQGHAAPVNHALAGWMKPARLVAAWLSTPGVQVRGQVSVAALRRASTDAVWQVLDAQGRELTQAELVVVAAAHSSAALLNEHLPPASPMPLNPVRGQISWGLHLDTPPDAANAPWPPTPVNGNGHFIPSAPMDAGRAWLCGSTYERGETDPRPSAAEVAAGHAANLEKLRVLLPEVAQRLAPDFEAGSVRAWSQIRCTSRDRRPLVGFLDGRAGHTDAPSLASLVTQVTPVPHGLCRLAVLTALGSRGLSFAALGAELLAAQLHAEPLPVPRRLAQALDIRRALPKTDGP